MTTRPAGASGPADASGATVRSISSQTYLEDTMSQGDKAAYWRELKALGVQFDKHYRDYTTDELQKAYARHVEAGNVPPMTATPGPGPAPAPPSSTAAQAPPKPEIAERDPEEMAGQRLNTNPYLEPIRTDPDTGFVWYQEEVQKTSYARPRGRRVLKYNDPGVVKESATDGQYTEEFEVAGQERRASEAKITLPSYQVGIYQDPRYPFKIHVYNGQTGFDLFEVEDYYGGAERIPEDVKRKYVENVLCYDIRTVVRNIETEFRRLQLAGRID